MTDTFTLTQLVFKVASHTHIPFLSIAIDCDVITHFPPSTSLPLALLWPWSILFEVIIAFTLLPTTENERVREWLYRTCGPLSASPYSLDTSCTLTQNLLQYPDCSYSLLCCPSVLCLLPELSSSRLQPSKQTLGPNVIYNITPYSI